jgi:hypothetical protein
MPLTPQHTTEEALRQIEDRCAMLRFFADSIRQIDSVPDAAVFSGLADDLAEIAAMAHAARRALDVSGLSTEIGTGRRRRA